MAKKNHLRYEYGDSEAEKAPILVVLKVQQMHCGSCVEKIRKCVLDFPGVEVVKIEPGLNRVVVVGFVDPYAVRENLKWMINMEVELVSPRPDKALKSKELPVSTGVLKIKFHCDGCSKKIRRTITKTRGVYNLSMDKGKEHVIVQGRMDMEELKERLREKLKRDVELVDIRRSLAEDSSSSSTKGFNGGEWYGDSLHSGHQWSVVPVHHVNRCCCGSVPVFSGPYLEHFSDENAHSCSIL